MRTIGFDIDGVLYDFQYVLYNHLKIHHNLVQDFSDFWRMERSGDYSRQVYNDLFWHNIIRVPVLYEAMDISSHNLAILQELAKDFELIYITHRPTEIKHVTEMWFERNKLPYHYNLYFVEDKSIPILKHQCEYFIDDLVKNIKDLQKVTNAILFKREWHTKENLKYPYISDLQELLEMNL